MKKNKIFINLSNHPSLNWSNRQIDEATVYGIIIDIPFPKVDPNADEYEIEKMATDLVAKIKYISESEDAIVTVHIMGEMNLSFSIVNKLLEKNICCVASTAYRDVEELDDGSKSVKFEFKQFRKYVK